MGLFLFNYPEVDWMHRSAPQKRSTLMSVNQRSSWSTGLGLGGTGNLNLMIHLRGHRRDFDNWARITGDPGWSWEGVLPYFKSYEDYEEPGDEGNHGYSGDLRVEAPDFIGRASKATGSIQPVLVVTNTQASTLMIAEKGADMIDSFWRAYEVLKGNGSYSISTTTTTNTTIGQEPIPGNGNDVVGNNTNLLYNINITHVGDGYDDEKSN